jgi:UDP-4-amino-4,6-dideoxy-N-acetyl-beta-L-altrosamine N-acetyltransferase
MSMIDLRQIHPDDGERLFNWRREREVDRWMYQSPPPDMETHRRWLQGFLDDPDRLGWMITQDGQPCGFLILTGVTSTQQRAQWGWSIGEADARGRGAGRAAQALGLDIAFRELGLQRVWAEVRADNEAALKAQAAAGFKREGYLRRHAFKDGEFRDVVILGILAEEWAARRDKVRADLAASGLIRKD